MNESPGDQATLEFSHWFDDCQTAIQVAQEENLNSGIVLVGSSMGAWISLRMVQDNQDLIKGLVLVAPAINFMWSFYLVISCFYSCRNKIENPQINRQQT